jgi:hypothetical protein
MGLNEISRIVQVVTLTDLRKYPTHLYQQAAGHFWERSLHTTPSLVPTGDGGGLARQLQRAAAVVDWHYGVKNERTLLRSDMGMTDMEECNARASEKVARIGFGF